MMFAAWLVCPDPPTGGEEASWAWDQSGSLQVRGEVRGSHLLLLPALLCHKDTAKGKKYPPVGGFR